jgi:hypothetical protein
VNGVRIIRSRRGGPLGAPVWDFDVVPHPDREFSDNFSFGIVDGAGRSITDLRCYLMRRLKTADGEIMNIRFLDGSNSPLPADAELYVELRSPPV